MTDISSPSIAELAKALAKAQGQFTHAAKDANNPHFGNKYADLASVWDAIREPLATNGLAIVQLPQPCDAQGVLLLTRMMHNSGEWIDSLLFVPAMKNDAQGFGSALTYARRYALAAIAGIAQDDDDGNAAAKSAPKARQAPMQETPTPRSAPRQQPASGQGQATQTDAAPPVSRIQREMVERGLIADGKATEAATAMLTATGYPKAMGEWTAEQRTAFMGIVRAYDPFDGQ